MQADLEDLHKRLNEADVLPQSSYRRNRHEYELVCYVNNMIGCCISRNHAALGLFRSRAEKFMDDNPTKPELHGYYALVRTYLTAIAGFITP